MLPDYAPIFPLAGLQAEIEHCYRPCGIVREASPLAGSWIFRLPVASWTRLTSGKSSEYRDSCSRLNGPVLVLGHRSDVHRTKGESFNLVEISEFTYPQWKCRCSSRSTRFRSLSDLERAAVTLNSPIQRSYLPVQPSSGDRSSASGASVDYSFLTTC